jgi:hypothetical protein
MKNHGVGLTVHLCDGPKPICKFPHPFAHEINANWLGICVSHKSSPGVHQFETRVAGRRTRASALTKSYPALFITRRRHYPVNCVGYQWQRRPERREGPVGTRIRSNPLTRPPARTHQTRPTRNCMWASISLAVSERASECVRASDETLSEMSQPFADRDTERWCTKTLGLPDVILNGRATLAQEIDSIKVTRTPAH